MTTLQEDNRPVAACVAQPRSSSVQARNQFEPSCCAGPTPGNRALHIMVDFVLALAAGRDRIKQQHLPDTSLRTSLALPAGT